MLRNGQNVWPFNYTWLIKMSLTVYDSKERQKEENNL